MRRVGKKKDSSSPVKKLFIEDMDREVDNISESDGKEATMNPCNINLPQDINQKDAELLNMRPEPQSQNKLMN